jgi:hypothetical protein
MTFTVWLKGQRLALTASCGPAIVYTLEPMAIDYGLLASMSSILSDVWRQQREVWDFPLWWVLIALALAFIFAVRYLFSEDTGLF